MKDVPETFQLKVEPTLGEVREVGRYCLLNSQLTWMTRSSSVDQVDQEVLLQ